MRNSISLWNTECSTQFYNLSVLAFVNFWRESLYPTHTAICPSTLSLKLLCHGFFILCIFAIKSSGLNQDVKFYEGAFWWCTVYVSKVVFGSPILLLLSKSTFLVNCFWWSWPARVKLETSVTCFSVHLSSCIVLKSCQITFGLWMLEGRSVMPCNW